MWIALLVMALLWVATLTGALLTTPKRPAPQPAPQQDSAAPAATPTDLQAPALLGAATPATAAWDGFDWSRSTWADEEHPQAA